jgi:hypothetical protein
VPPPPRAPSSRRLRVPKDLLNATIDAAARGDFRTLANALDAWPVNALNAVVDEDGGSLLHVVATRAPEPLEALRVLVARAVDVRSVDRWKETALYALAKRGPAYLDCMAFLLQAGASVNSANHMGRTVLHEALVSHKQNPLPVLELLILHTVDLNQLSQNGQLPLFLVARLCPQPAPVMQLLLQAYAWQPKLQADINLTSGLPERRHLAAVDFGPPLLALARYGVDPVDAMVVLLHAGAQMSVVCLSSEHAALQGSPLRSAEQSWQLLRRAEKQASGQKSPWRRFLSALSCMP